MIPYAILTLENESDREFMSSIYIQYERLMYSSIRTVTQDSWLVDDIFQTTFEKLIDKVHLLRTLNRDRLVNYLIVASRNTAYNLCHYQDRYNRNSIFNLCDEPSSDQSFPDIEEYIILQNQLESFCKVWPKLDENSKYILEAKYILEMTDGEIAADLNIKPSSVRMALSRARKNAMSLLHEHNIEI